MINAEEHKKLLAQVAELERNSVSYFDVEKEFFLIDSNNLAEVKTRLYGYSIQATGIYEQDNLTEEAVAGLDGRGCYVYVEARDGQITIKQDLNGSWGIYLFRHGDYFALSNSFFRLLDHVKFHYTLTVNRDYCHYLWVEALCSNAYSETAINEIQLVDRSAILQIDVATKDLKIEEINHKEHTVPLDSEEGIEVLDHWVEFWSSILRGVARHTKFIQTDLSGGFDSRIALIPLLHSGIDFNEIYVRSIQGNVHTFSEDYAIASLIANHYGFKLNQSLPELQCLNYSLADVFNFNQYGGQTFTNMPRFRIQKRVDKLYWLTGSAGETIRMNWGRFGELKEFIETRTERTTKHSLFLSRELSYSTELVLKSAFRDIGHRYHIENKPATLLQYLCQETQCRNHFGKGSLIEYFSNSLHLSPALDPEIRTLQLKTSECPDANLLVALLFTRHEPDLLKFPFQGNRSIKPETIRYARNLNERFPICHKKVDNLTGGGQTFHLQPRDLQAEKILSSGSNNKLIPEDLPEACLKAMFDSSRMFGLFKTYFDEELYRYAASYYDNKPFGRERLLYAIVGIARVLEGVEISKRNRPPHEDIIRSLSEDFGEHYDDAQILRKFKDYFTATISVKLTAAGDLQIFSVSDNRAAMMKPTWLQKDGVCYIISSYSGNLEFVAKVFAEGSIQLSLLGFPCAIDYTKLTIDGQRLFDKLTPIRRDDFRCYEITNIKAGTEIKIEVEWLPHRSDT